MHIVENGDNVDDALFTWNKMFSEVADQHAPVKRRRVKGTPLPWMNSQISDSMKERDWAHRKARKSNSARHWSMYAKLRNKVNGLIRNAKSKGAFHLSELTGQTLPVVTRISLLIKTIQPDQSNPK